MVCLPPAAVQRENRDEFPHPVRSTAGNDAVNAAAQQVPDRVIKARVAGHTHGTCVRNQRDQQQQ